MAARPSLAQRMRAHRAAFTLALELGVTVAEAEAELARRAARDRWETACRRLAALDARPRRTSPARRMTIPSNETPAGLRRWWLD